MQNNEVHIIKGEPTVSIIADMQLNVNGISDMLDWVGSHRPECLPDGYNGNDSNNYKVTRLFPHNLYREAVGSYGKELSDNELLVELAGRKCYDSFGLKAGKKSNAEYIENTQSGEIKHASILYHAKISFFFAGISRRVSHELIRNHVGADRDEEGAPSQESTRFTHHYGWFVAAPRDLDNPGAMATFKSDMQDNYNAYLEYIDNECLYWAMGHSGEQPKGLDRKRIYEAASHRLSHSAETSMIWTTNPGALTKLLIERDNEAADAEFQRFAKKLKRVCLEYAPNLFPRFVKEAKNAAG